MAELVVSPAFAVGREEKMAAAAVAADEAGTGGTAPRAGLAEAGTGQSEARSLTRVSPQSAPGAAAPRCPSPPSPCCWGCRCGGRRRRRTAPRCPTETSRPWAGCR